MENEMGGAYSKHGREMRRSNKTLVGKSERKRAHGKNRRKSENNIQMTITEIGCDCRVD
jgi:hypothetical protein